VQVENRNTYNTTGRVGPLYPKPEYRPPIKDLVEDSQGEGKVKGDGDKKKASSESLILSDSLKRKSAVKNEVPLKLNVVAAKALVEESAEAIMDLKPLSTTGCPHKKIEGDGLLYPIYA
jgi:hypothetical protein